MGAVLSREISLRFLCPSFLANQRMEQRKKSRDTHETSIFRKFILESLLLFQLKLLIIIAFDRKKSIDGKSLYF